MRIGIDLGGTKIEGILIDANGRECSRLRVASPRHDYNATVAAVAGVVHRLQGHVGETASVGVGIPGTVSRQTGLVKNANSTWLIGKPLDRDLASALGRPVRVANDANCFAISEAVDGAGAGAEVIFGVILGTGVGGGFVVNGHPVNGINGITGEWGHNPLPWPHDDERPGPPCYCGRYGCIETFLSGPGFSTQYQDIEGCQADPPAIVHMARQNDKRAAHALDRYAERLARALAAVINIIDPDVIVLGGGLSNIESLYEAVPKIWGEWIFSDIVQTRLARARHGASGGVRGAAWLWPPSP